MSIRHSIKMAVTGLITNKSRSILTILGIVIAITAIVFIVSVGRSAENLILSELQSMGAETIVIRPGKEPKGPADFADTLFSDSLKERDVEALKKKSNVPGLLDIAPAVIVPGSVSYLGETFRPMIFGWSAEFMAEVLNLYPERGVLFDENDIKQKTSVAIIGSKVARELFGDNDPIGQNIKIKDRKFRVIGIYSSRGQVAFFNVDEVVLLPYSTARQYLLGIDHYHEIITRVKSPDLVARTVSDIKYTLRELHGITDPEKDDFFVVTQEGLVNQVKNIINALTAFLSLVVAISLVVGGIGVMNIMLVSVTERTKEIGLRKAVGATNKDILRQFLLESVLLTAIGGIIGIALGVALSFITSLVLSYTLSLMWEFVFPLSAAILGFGVSAVVGLVFGLYPARQAAKKNPIDALRYE